MFVGSFTLYQIGLNQYTLRKYKNIARMDRIGGAGSHMGLTVRHLNLMVLAIFDNLPVGRSGPYFMVLNGV